MSSSPRPLSFSCPRCKVVLHVDPNRAGTTIRCEHCQAELRVPGSSAVRESEFDDLFDVESSPQPDAGPSATTGPSVANNAPRSLPSELWSELPGSAATVDEPQDLLQPPPAPSAAVAARGGAGSDPFAAVDDDAPLRLEGSGMIDPHERMIHVRCPVCDSVMLAAHNQLGTQIQCTDCHSTVTVTVESSQQPAPRRAAAPLTPSSGLGEAEALNPFPDLGPAGTPPPVPAPEEYGLAPLSAELLRPRTPVEALGSQDTAAAGGKPAAPAASPKPANRSTDSAGRSGYDHRLSDSIDAYESEIRSHQLPELPLDEAEVFRFPHQFLAPFRDSSVWIFVLALALLSWAGQGLSDLGTYLNGISENGVQVYGAIGLILRIVAANVGLLFTIVAGVVINQLVEAAIHRRHVFHPPEMGILAWLNSFLVVAVSVWGALLFGMIFGMVVGSLTQSAIVGGLFTTAIAFLLMPLGILGAYYNGSPIKIFSPVIVGTIRSHRSGWLRFYRWMALWFGLLVAGALLSWLPLFGSPLLAVLRAVVVVLVGRTIGLLAQIALGRWIENDGD